MDWRRRDYKREIIIDKERKYAEMCIKKHRKVKRTQKDI
jgi:hypothetical protein